MTAGASLKFTADQASLQEETEADIRDARNAAQSRSHRFEVEKVRGGVFEER